MNEATSIDELYKYDKIKLKREKKYLECINKYGDICMCESHFYIITNKVFLENAFIKLQYCSNIRELYLFDLGLKDDTNITFPPLLEWLDISNNHLTKLPIIPESVKILVCSQNKLISINLPFNSKVEHLFCSYNMITSLDNLSSNIIELVCSNNKIIRLDNLPLKINSLKCSYNEIKTLDNLPQSITWLECNSCLLEELDNLPPNIRVLRCQNNKIIKLHNLPEKIKIIENGNNPCFSDEMTIKLVKELQCKNKYNL